jgi:hypothetical protein
MQRKVQNFECGNKHIDNAPRDKEDVDDVLVCSGPRGHLWTNTE